LGSERRISYLEQFTEETWLHLVFVAKNGTFENVDFCQTQIIIFILYIEWKKTYHGVEPFH
jgi:hypothetical protein